MHLHPKPKYRHADLDKPRRGDRFPNVGYVRRLMALMGLPQPDQSYLDYGERRSA
jgi:hypothetical protein